MNAIDNFNYSLQKILNLKSNEKIQAEWLLSKAIVELSNEENDLCRLHNEMAAIQESLAEESQSSSTISNLLLIQQYIEHLEQLILNKTNGVIVSKDNVVFRQQSLTNKMVDEKIWIKAREKAYLKFSSLLLKKDQKDMDELASSRHELK